MFRSVDRSTLPMDDGRWTLNGVPFGGWPVWLTSDGVEIGEATPSTSIADMPGTPGVDQTLEDASGAAIPSRRTITLHLVTAGTRRDCIDTIRRIGDLNGRMITFGDAELDGEWTGRCTVGQAEERPRHGAYLIDLTIDAEPYLRGHEETAELAAGGNGIHISGNRPCWPEFTLLPTQGATSISVSDGNGHMLSISPGTTITGTVTIRTDPTCRETRTNGNLTPPTLDSDYFPLLPGTNDITLKSCSGRVTYRPNTII